LNESIKRLEEKIAFLERHVTEQDKAMLELAEEIAAVRRELKAMRGRSTSGLGPSHPSGESGDTPEERPPHY
jgi:SlyX protein